eukprot:594162-Karenia_brevis.AAC.1
MEVQVVKTVTMYLKPVPRGAQDDIKLREEDIGQRMWEHCCETVQGRVARGRVPRFNWRPRMPPQAEGGCIEGRFRSFSQVWDRLVELSRQCEKISKVEWRRHMSHAVGIPHSIE